MFVQHKLIVHTPGFCNFQLLIYRFRFGSGPARIVCDAVDSVNKRFPMNENVRFVD